MCKKINIALFSPNVEAYSETFIRNHKHFLSGNVFFYYGGVVPTVLEGKGRLQHSLKDDCVFFIRKLLGREIYYQALESNALVTSLKQNEIDVVYAEYGTTGAEVIGICKEAGVPLIVNFHGYDASIKKILEVYRYKYQELFQFAKAIIVVSKEMKQNLIDLGCSEQKIKYIVNAPADEFYDLQPSYSDLSFISVGRFVDKKAPYYNILAFQQVVEKYPEAKLYMIGDGPLLEVCQNLISYLKLENNIILLGVLDQSEIQRYYTQARGFVQHSITSLSGDSEGMPVAVLEASASGLPVISTIHAGIPDVIIDGETGFLVKEHDVNKMASCMIRLIEDEGLAKLMGAAGRKNIKTNFNFSMHIGAINEVVYNVLK